MSFWNALVCTPSSASVCVNFHIRDGRTDGQTPGIEFGASYFKNVTSGGNNFNEFPDNQLTEFRIFIG